MCPHFAAAEKWLDKELYKLGHAVEEATADSQVHCLTFAKLTLVHLGGGWGGGGVASQRGLKCKKQGQIVKVLVLNMFLLRQCCVTIHILSSEH